MSQSKFGSYERVLQFLRYHKIQQPGKLATYLYSVFVVRDIRFCAETARHARVISDDTDFMSWLRMLQSFGVLRVTWTNAHIYRFVQLGSSVLKYFNDDILNNNQVATQTDLDNLESKLNERLDRSELRIKKLCLLQGIVYDPPDFVELDAYLAKNNVVPF